MNKLKNLLFALPLALIPLNSHAQDKEAFIKVGLSASSQNRKELVNYPHTLGLSFGVEHMLTNNLSLEYSMAREFATFPTNDSKLFLSETNLGINIKSNKEEKNEIYFGSGAKLNNIYYKKGLNEMRADYFGGYCKVGINWTLDEELSSYLEAEYSLTSAKKYPFPGLNSQIKFTLGLGFN